MTFWAAIALVFGMVAVFGSNIATLLPPNFITGLHSNRLEGGSLSNLRAQVAELRTETSRMRNENDRLATQLKLAEQGQGEVNRRVGALETSLPLMMEEKNRGNEIDRLAVTSAIEQNDDSEIMPAEGGSVSVIQTPIEAEVNPEPMTPATPNVMPAPIAVKSKADMPSRVIVTVPKTFGVALGPQVALRDAAPAWNDITRKVGPLLLGLGPVLSGDSETELHKLIAGPIDDYAQAQQLCRRVVRIGISCLPVPFAGDALTQ